MAENVHQHPNRLEPHSGKRLQHVAKEKENMMAGSKSDSTTFVPSLCFSSSKVTPRQAIGSAQSGQSPTDSRASKVLKNKTMKKLQATRRSTPGSDLKRFSAVGIDTDLDGGVHLHQPWESPSYEFGVPLNEFRPAHGVMEECDGSDDAINSSMSVSSECSLNTTSSTLEDHVLQLLESYQSDGHVSVRSACENPVARTLMSQSAFGGALDDVSVSHSMTPPRRHSSPPAVGSDPPENASHRPQALHASASAPILYFSPRPR
ncbi:hypothetical protein FisN_20Lh131 [Fistulifera solaris]|uniref:Uncharacterized protein n=1 Tax=Fistulifera solaris TaxID=1519565 RepID=A0A1Z5KRM7_FISSO|nr:hypothetical protein FisN_20Lh131 [Fistulifera solaris]|eukprot:GAX28837.1 hypothetical protein FisN_20Lh131 [Fistulifera solaris]